MNGTVAPSSSSAMAACTWARFTDNSLAIFSGIFMRFFDFWWTETKMKQTQVSRLVPTRSVGTRAKTGRNCRDCPYVNATLFRHRYFNFAQQKARPFDRAFAVRVLLV